MEQNKTLCEINFSQNKLSNLFCSSFGKVLKINNKLCKVNISRNDYIRDVDFQFVMECLVDNQNIISLGNLEETKIGVKLRESVDIILQLNRHFSKNQIPLEKSQAQKIDFFNASKDNFNKENSHKKLDDNNINLKIAEANENVNNNKDESLNFDELIIKYGVEFHIEDYQDFNFEQQ